MNSVISKYTDIRLTMNTEYVIIDKIRNKL